MSDSNQPTATLPSSSSNMACSTGYCTKLSSSWKKMEKTLNDAVSNARIGRYFKLQERNTNFTEELRAGTATFLTMAYIISVNATILADSGGTCSFKDCSISANQTSATPDCVFKPNLGYVKCLEKTKSDLIVATILSSMIGSFAMGVLANLPFGLAPGMGANAYVAYNMVGFHGSGSMSYQTAMAVVLTEGCIFLVIAALGLRAKLARLIPNSVRLSCAAGIGLFIAFTGLQIHQGLGLVGPDESTLVTITACSAANPLTGECYGGKMRSPTFWLGSAGFLITCYGLMKEIKGCMIYGIIFVTLVSWIRTTSVTYFPNTSLGNANYKYFKQVVDLHKIESTICAIRFTNFDTGGLYLALFTLVCVDVLATTGTLYTLAEIGGFLDQDGNFEGQYSAFMVDGGATVVGALLGVSPMATYIESSAGMKEGGRTGLTAVFVAGYFLLSFFFLPLLVSVPPWAIGPSLVVVGILMMKVVKDINWENIKEAVPGFITMLLMPLTFSITNGIVAGIGLHVALGVLDYVAQMIVSLGKGRRTLVGGEA